MAIYDVRTVRDGKYWACAFRKDNSKEAMKNIAEPHQVEVRNGYVYKLSKDGKCLKSGVVSTWARRYTDTQKECVNLYNDLIKEHIVALETLKQEALTYLIKIDEE